VALVQPAGSRAGPGSRLTRRDAHGSHPSPAGRTQWRGRTPYRGRWHAPRRGKQDQRHRAVPRRERGSCFGPPCERVGSQRLFTEGGERAGWLPGSVAAGDRRAAGITTGASRGRRAAPRGAPEPPGGAAVSGCGRAGPSRAGEEGGRCGARRSPDGADRRAGGGRPVEPDVPVGRGVRAAPCAGAPAHRGTPGAGPQARAGSSRGGRRSRGRLAPGGWCGRPGGTRPGEKTGDPSAHPRGAARPPCSPAQGAARARHRTRDPSGAPGRRRHSTGYAAGSLC